MSNALGEINYEIYKTDLSIYLSIYIYIYIYIYVCVCVCVFVCVSLDSIDKDYMAHGCCPFWIVIVRPKLLRNLQNIYIYTYIYIYIYIYIYYNSVGCHYLTSLAWGVLHKALHPRDDVERLYVSRKEGERGLVSIKDSVDASIQKLEDYIQKCDGARITAIRNDTDNTMDNRMTITRKQKWEAKQLYGRFKRLINKTSHDKTWAWLRKGNFKRETESLLIATQNNAGRTNHIKARIDKTHQNSKCRQCGDSDQTMNHIISECSKLAQKEYKLRHGWVDKLIDCRMCNNLNLTIPTSSICTTSNCPKK